MVVTYSIPVQLDQENIISSKPSWFEAGMYRMESTRVLSQSLSSIGMNFWLSGPM